MRFILIVLLWFILLALSWPLALLLIVLYPFIWLIMLPFRLVGFTVSAVFTIITSILTFPFRAATAMAK